MPGGVKTFPVRLWRSFEERVRRLFPEMEDDLVAAIAAGVKGAL